MKKFGIALLLILVLLFLSPFVIFQYLGMQPIYNVYHSIEKDMQENSLGYNTIFSSMFDASLKCPHIGYLVCKEDVQEGIMSALKIQDLNFPGYYVRLTSEGKLQKLFLSGEVKEITPNTEGEKRVANLLLGKEHNLLWNIWRVDGSTANVSYLNDLYSEVEVVVPFKVNNRVKGALVYLYGD